jgi:hypothetical protein
MPSRWQGAAAGNELFLAAARVCAPLFPLAVFRVCILCQCSAFAFCASVLRCILYQLLR